MSSVQISSVKKDFGAFQVVKGVDIDIEDGSFVVLVGPSGCGKSTLLRMIAGLEEITSGEVKIDGAVVNDIEAKDRDIAMVFQSYALYPHMTVEQNLAFALKLRKYDGPEITTRTGNAMQILGLTELRDRYPKQLSGGQRQRVAMGRAIVRNPKVFLFDEPLSNLDAQLRVHMRAEIKDLHERLGTTSIYVTHDQIEAMTMADVVVVMRAGLVEQTGSPLDLYDYPKSKFVAGFIGSPQMNFLRCRGERNGEIVARYASDKTVLLPGAPEPIVGQEIFVGIRPEHTRLSDRGGDNALEGEVVLTETTGSETIVRVKIEGADWVVLEHSRLRLARGQRVFLRLDPEKLHYFDAISEQRIS